MWPPAAPAAAAVTAWHHLGLPGTLDFSATISRYQQTAAATHISLNTPLMSSPASPPLKTMCFCGECFLRWGADRLADCCYHHISISIVCLPALQSLPRQPASQASLTLSFLLQHPAAAAQPQPAPQLPAYPTVLQSSSLAGRLHWWATRTHTLTHIQTQQQWQQRISGSSSNKKTPGSPHPYFVAIQAAQRGKCALNHTGQVNNRHKPPLGAQCPC